MREIKFRAWDKKRKRMYKVFHLHLSSFEGPWATVEGIELMQFTGLKDKNGVEIFEGDVIKSHYGSYGSVSFSPLPFPRFVLAYGWLHPSGKEESWQDYEVIGNIYQNPELLRKEE